MSMFAACAKALEATKRHYMLQTVRGVGTASPISCESLAFRPSLRAIVAIIPGKRVNLGPHRMVVRRSLSP